ncbi:hypothetical protein GWG67_28290 [Bradyrhizobium sp. CSS354]|nr:hypothetical protein [Bradyrhizobium sp. CSS354]
MDAESARRRVVSEIAAQLGRHAGSVRRMARAMGLILKRYSQPLASPLALRSSCDRYAWDMPSSATRIIALWKAAPESGPVRGRRC